MDKDFIRKLLEDTRTNSLFDPSYAVQSAIQSDQTLRPVSGYEMYLKPKVDAISSIAPYMIPGVGEAMDAKDLAVNAKQAGASFLGGDIAGGAEASKDSLLSLLSLAIPFAGGMGSVKKVASELPMDEASRLARAKDMGFDTDKVYYHGTSSKIDAFDPKFLGHGNDSFGSGFYFTPQKEIAETYTVPKKWDGLNSDPSIVPIDKPNVIEAYLNLQKPVPEAGKLSKLQIKKILEKSPNLEDRLWDFGDIESEGRNRVLNEAINTYYEHQFTPLSTLNNLSNDFYSGAEGEFLQNVNKITGWDHVRSTESGGEIVAVFKPNQIRSTQATFDPAKKNSSNLLASFAGLLGLGGLSQYNQGEYD